MWKKTCGKNICEKIFLFWKFLSKIAKFPFLEIPIQNWLIMSSIKFPFMVIPTKHVSTMSSIKISFYGNPHSTCVAYIIHTSFGGLCESPSLQVNHTNCGVNAHTHLDKVHSCVTTWVGTTDVTKVQHSII